MATKLIVGLGNPGREYEKTRHNLGAMVVRRLAGDAGVVFKKSRLANAEAAELSEDGTAVLLITPLTYMNNSGIAVREMAGFLKIATEDILVVCDDINLNLGEMRLRADGSDGGHNGLKSIIAEMGTSSFPRLKLGVGAPLSKERQADYVLSNFSAREAGELGGFLEQAAECCRLWIRGDAARAMTQFNQRKDKKDNE